MVWRRRSWWLALVLVGYVGAAALRARPASRPLWLGLVAAPLLLWFGWMLIAPPVRGPDRITPSARSAGRLAVSGVPLVVLAELAPPTDAFLAAWIVGAAMASMGSILAIMRVGSLGGIAARAAPKRLDAVVVAGVLWSVALAVALVRALGGEQAAALTGPQTSRFALVVASLGSLGVTLVAAMRHGSPK